jgi:hypothetical protein
MRVAATGTTAFTSTRSDAANASPFMRPNWAAFFVGLIQPRSQH